MTILRAHACTRKPEGSLDPMTVLPTSQRLRDVGIDEIVDERKRDFS